MRSINEKINHLKLVAYKNAIETIKYYKSCNSHKVNTIQAYCNLMGYSEWG